VIRTAKSEGMSTGQGTPCMGKERNVRHLVGQPEERLFGRRGRRSGFTIKTDLIWDKEFCVLHVQSNTTIFYLVVQ